ncbi:hypothetical protein MATL_G00092090 [Megalops atlanticus]|uniref:Protein phosphatase 1 regulatory subunit 26 N-terminal domain-containing protein n=1 Tax=Megalops atlanticus TaxID=7932 RepID=A0A9D3TFX5_MEGAT|nr:hypothetical protein MATL_G00092090 [Megalops atlanticus]
MFLKNVPPVVALHTEWRSYGPTRSFSLPLCFNDTDSDISTPGTPIPEKVQMIIDGLRSTQSSLDMSSEYEGNLKAGPALAPGCAGKAGDATHKARHRGAVAGIRVDDQRADPVGADFRNHDSDSDDSVDRGIEEAIQEYLKEKGDHKRKLEPATSPSQVPKQAKRELFLSDNPKHSESNKILTASSNHIPKSVKASYSVAIDKKRFKNERGSEGNLLPCKKGDLNKAVKNSSFESQKHPFDLTTYPYKVQPLGVLKVVEESPDSSSDDGIEEAIQHYQLEKKKENPEDPRKSSKPLRLNEESDSSSDDGIEEAIRRYQLEKQIEKSRHVTKVSKPSQPKQTQVNLPAEMGVSPLSQSPLYISPPSPKRVREVKVASASHQHDVACSHQTKSFILTGEVRCAVCPATGGHENTGQDGFIEPSHRSPETPISVMSPVHTSAPARLPCGYFMHGRPREGNPGQNPSPGLSENEAHKDTVQAKPGEWSNLEGNHVQSRSRDLGRGDDRKVCPREREDRKRGEGELKGGREEECIDETDGSEERPSGSQRSKERRQSPRLFLSTSIDPGMTVRPYITLTSAQRHLRYSRRHLCIRHSQTQKLKIDVPCVAQIPQKEPQRINPNYAMNVKMFYSKRKSPCAALSAKKTNKKKLVKRKLQFHT